ncbi:MAG: STAS domain-containing protein [Actinomycetota bacterium]|nr:STAS domain-containing protein [Actinomycetota bacterium]
MIAAAGPTFAVRAEVHGDDIRVVVAGEVDLSSAPALRAALLSAVDDAASVVAIDLCNVSYLDSTGVHCLFDAATAANGKAKTLRVEHAPAHVARVLRISGLADVMSIETDD